MSLARLLPGRAWVFLGLTASVVLLDQWTKKLATVYLLDSGVRSVPVVGEYVRLTYVENRGAAFGLLQEQTAFFIIVGVTVVGVIVVSYRQLAQPGWLLNICLGLQLGGAIGNLIDRMRYGFVVDFVDLTVWPVFNVADSAIVCGVTGLAYTLLFPQRSREVVPDA